MNAGQLMEWLKSVDPEMEVYFNNADFCCAEPTSVQVVELVAMRESLNGEITWGVDDGDDYHRRNFPNGERKNVVLIDSADSGAYRVKRAEQEAEEEAEEPPPPECDACGNLFGAVDLPDMTVPVKPDGVARVCKRCYGEFNEALIARSRRRPVHGERL